MASSKTSPYLFYALAALCVVILAPYAGCHIITSKPQPEGPTHIEDSGSMTQGVPSEEDRSSTAEAGQNPSATAASDKLDDIDRALNLE